MITAKLEAIEACLWRYSVFDDMHYGVIIAENEKEAKRKLYDHYYEEASLIQNKSRPTIRDCHIKLWNIIDDGYYGNGICETT